MSATRTIRKLRERVKALEAELEVSPGVPPAMVRRFHQLEEEVARLTQELAAAGMPTRAREARP